MSQPGLPVPSLQLASCGFRVTKTTGFPVSFTLLTHRRSCHLFLQGEIRPYLLSHLPPNPGHHHLCLDSGRGLLPGPPRRPMSPSATAPPSGQMFRPRCPPIQTASFTLSRHRRRIHHSQNPPQDRFFRMLRAPLHRVGSLLHIPPLVSTAP